MDGHKINKHDSNKALEETGRQVLSSEKREDIWAIVIAGMILILCSVNPDAMHTFFKKTLFIF